MSHVLLEKKLPYSRLCFSINYFGTEKLTLPNLQAVHRMCIYVVSILPQVSMSAVNMCEHRVITPFKAMASVMI